MATLFAAIEAGEVTEVERLLADGANPRLSDGCETPLHVAARRGPLALVETLIAGGALVWQTDSEGRTPLDAARAGESPERAAIVALLDRNSIADPMFRSAVAAIHAGDVAGLRGLIAEQPHLLRERNRSPDAFRRAERNDYFRDPRLFWYVANNPTMVDRMAPNIVEIANVMIEAGIEQSDLDYTLGLVATSSKAREQRVQLPLIRRLIDAGAVADREVILAAAAYRELEALRELVHLGAPVSAPVAAALGDREALARLLRSSDAAEITIAFGIAVINGKREAAALALDAGADLNAFLPVHAHMTALHQLAQNDDVPFIEFLLARGARTDIPDRLWSSTPLGWATFFGKHGAREALSF